MGIFRFIIFIVVRPAVSNTYIILIVIVLYIYQDCERFSNLDYLFDRCSIGVLAASNVHPAVYCSFRYWYSHNLQHVHVERLEDHSLLLTGAGCTRQLAGRVPDFLDSIVCLDDDDVVYSTTEPSGRGGAAAFQWDHEIIGRFVGPGSHVPALGIVGIALAVDDTIEGSVELERDRHPRTTARHVETRDVGVVVVVVLVLMRVRVSGR